MNSQQVWEATVDTRVHFHDLDPMQVVWHGNYARFYELARFALFEKINYNYDQMRESGYSWPIIDMHIRYPRAARYGQLIRVHAQIIEWEYRLKIAYTITDVKTGERINTATTTQVAVNMETGAMCYATPKILLQKLGITHENEGNN